VLFHIFTGFTMSTRLRSLFFGIGMLAVIGLLLLWYRTGVAAARRGTPQPMRIALGDLPPGQVEFKFDMGGPKDTFETRRLMFLRKADGTLRAWYFHVVGRVPAAPDDDDWRTPGAPCEPFEVDPEREMLSCFVNDREHNRRLVLRWSWDGKSSGPLAPDLRQVPGEEKDGSFVYADEALEPALRARK
jgi:hypothetical protein